MNDRAFRREAVRWTAVALFLVAAAAARGAEPPGDLEKGFRDPPEATKPWCYWYWISDNISKEGISRDLEAMARVGIGEALVGNIFLDDVPAGRIKVLSEEWWGFVEHAIREGARTGVNIGLFNCPGWSQSGGPWIGPERAMRFLVFSEVRVRGPARIETRVPAPRGAVTDVALIAFPAPQDDGDSLPARRARVTCSPATGDAAKLADGDREGAVTFPAGAGAGKSTFTIEIELPEPLAARSLSLVPGDRPWSARCELQAEAAFGGGGFRTVRAFRFDRSNMEVNVGPMPRGPVTVSFPSATARRFRVVLSELTGRGALAEVELSAAARLESYVEKGLGKMHPTPQPAWDTYLWPPAAEPESPRLAVDPAAAIDLTSRLGPDGTLSWDAPPGDWVILRTGMAPTGTRNAPASPEGQGLEVDKMNREALKVHFDAFIGKVLSRMPASERRAFRHVVADSYEMGSQNWTDGFARTFRERYRYDPIPWLPVLTGRIVGGAERSDRFLWDLRRLVADRVARDYVGGLRDLCRPHGLELWLENYGHWGFPGEFLQYGGQSDRIGGEFWVTGDLGSIECRAASSAANIYGKPVVSAEAFTGGPPFQTAPWGMKARGDWAFCEGINHFVLHVYIGQPWEDRRPGVNAWFGTEFNRHNTWFDAGRSWIEYLRRSCFLLQQGIRVADVAYFIGEDAPKMTGPRRPALPPGRDFDDLNAEVILGGLRAEKGFLVLPHGTTYRALVLPDAPAMRPEVLRKVRDLVKAGATVLGSPPSRSPSLEDYPRCDEEVRRLAGEVWGDLAGAPSGERRFGEGRVIRGKSLADALEGPPDFSSGVRLLHAHRKAGGADIFFVSNQSPEAVATTGSFRTSGRAPELWRPETGRIERPAIYEEVAGTVRVPLLLAPSGSVFVVFREPDAGAARPVSARRDGEVVLDARGPVTVPEEPEAAAAASVVGSFTVAVWAKPAADTTLVAETNRGVVGLGDPRNDALFPPHGQAAFGDPGAAGSGLAVGRNGVCVFEHGSNYFAPVLVHPAALRDWTHLTVVYRDGRPALYLDGVLARQGLRSEHSVHPGVGAPGGGPRGFRGELGRFTMSPRALSDDEVARLSRTMPRPEAPAPAGGGEFFLRPDGAVEAVLWAKGTWELRDAAGTARTIAAESIPSPIEIAGSWQVRFGMDGGTLRAVLFEKLVDWSEHPEEWIRHFSGRASYRKVFDLPESAAGKPVRLDLGRVRDLAAVRLNGTDLGTLWTAPWGADATAAARPGSNLLEIEVVNVWNNRLAGDAALPPERRATFLAVPAVPRDAPLLPAGLVGPVTLSVGERVILERR
jgi:hypothetical protein